LQIKEYQKGLVWDENDKFIQQTWTELKQNILDTHGGIGIIAADFDELLRYGYGYSAISNPTHRRKHFSKLVAGANSNDDIELLADILGMILLRPWRTNMHGGWFIYYLRKSHNLNEFDAERAALVLNELYEVNDYSAKVLMYTLREFVFFDSPKDIYLYDLLHDTNMLRKELLSIINPAKVFISYAKEDDKIVERLYEELRNKGFNVWKDNHELLPGENWELKIRRSLKECEFAILCLSEVSVNKTGFFQEEVKRIYDLQRKRPSLGVFCVPVRINDFDSGLMPPEFEDLHYINLYDDWDIGIEKISKVIIDKRNI
jgi:hypothetical protein